MDLEVGDAVQWLGAEIEVVAFCGGTEVARNAEKLFTYEQGDRGILRWVYSGRGEDGKGALWEPAVIWEKDKEKKPRRILAWHLEITATRPAVQRRIRDIV